MERRLITVFAYICACVAIMMLSRSVHLNPFPTLRWSSIENQDDVTDSEDIPDGRNDSRTTLVPAVSVTKETEKDHVILITNGTESIPFKVGIAHCPHLPEHVKCNFSYASREVWNQSDAIIFRPFSISQHSDLWDYHRAGQKWVFEEHESPMKTWNTVRRENFDALWDQFNITILYTKDSSIQHYMYNISCVPRDEDGNLEVPNVDYLKGKEKSVLWIVGNCKWTMGRELYVDELMKYIDVDIFGPCGDHVVCGKYGEFQTTCVDNLLSKYKYFLSFENSFCEGYYTEKAIKTERVNTIPVVMGLVNYTEVLFPGTFIDVRDYKSPRLLAEYLKTVGNNSELYNGYIKRKHHRACSMAPGETSICKLCQHLYNNEGKTEILPDMREYWGKEKRCMSPDRFFEGVADEIVPLLDKKYLF
ncbi:hypothetical protein CAPTEDRAFT_215776 [Capitella teleta]|uniref:Fucosyltransferase n=1 Tax=Capitella teleta TaxID=283909 RepID=R7VBA9_CAPTE|nr:hypothetical protein CAPTEDRAFT_215776 [Capitella teleta]|eukprot:ELU15827.1 hypothetical protein CAPTEDRAFT_215776 [Capitella teleta]